MMRELSPSESRILFKLFNTLHTPFPLFQSYELKEESGLSSSMNTIWKKMNHPFQPKVPHQDDESTKFLSHCFSRDKLHM